MTNLVPGLIVGFREGLEAFLVLAVSIRFLRRSGRGELIASVWKGGISGMIASVLFGALLFAANDMLGGAGRAAKVWESASSFAAVCLVSVFIIWMIRHGASLKAEVERDVAARFGGKGLFSLAFVMVLREGVEIALFSFAGSYPLIGLGLGLVLALVLVLLVSASLIRVRLGAVFNLSLAYLVLQAGFLLGYGIHEGLSALKDLGMLAADSPWFARAFDFSTTVLDHRQGWLGLPLYVLTGWYSRPEWAQFLAQYVYTIGIFAFWLRLSRGKGEALA